MSGNPLSEQRFDVVTVGAGSAGLSFSIFAAEAGMKVAVVEQASQIGGTLHRTAGQLSAAGTKRQKIRGIVDSRAHHLTEVLRISRGRGNRELTELAVNEAPEMIDWLDEHGFRFHEDAPMIYYGHEPYTVPRTYWGEEAGISILRTFEPLWDFHVRAGTIVPFLSHSLGEIKENAGSVTGVTAASQLTGQLIQITADAVVLASGGFGANPRMYSSVTHSETVPPSASMIGNQGGGHEAAIAVGAVLKERKEILRLGHFAQPQDPTRVDLSLKADFESLNRLPREIWVNSRGQRFVDESHPVVTVQEHAVLEQPGATFWAVFDSAAVHAGAPLVRGWTPDDFVNEATGRVREIWMADSVSELAAKAGIDPGGLRTTVDSWNRQVGAEQSWKHARAVPINKAPFFALRCRGAILTTFSGLEADSHLRILNTSGDPIVGLFGVGEVLGVGTFNGPAWVGGMMLTPALALGRMLARQLADEERC